MDIIEDIKRKISYDKKLEREAKEVEQFNEKITKHTRVGDGADYGTKEISDIFYYSTLYDERDVMRHYKGDLYRVKELQPVTITGIVYKTYNKKMDKTERILHIGIARHHTNEHINYRNDEGFEVSRIYAEQSPDAIMRVSRQFNQESFDMICDGIVSGMRLKTMNA